MESHCVGNKVVSMATSLATTNSHRHVYQYTNRNHTTVEAHMGHLVHFTNDMQHNTRGIKFI